MGRDMADRFHLVFRVRGQDVFDMVVEARSERVARRKALRLASAYVQARLTDDDVTWCAV